MRHLHLAGRSIATAVVAICTMQTTHAQDLGTVLALAGATLKPYGINISRTQFVQPTPSWQGRWQLSFRYGPMPLKPEPIEIASWDSATIFRGNKALSSVLVDGGSIAAGPGMKKLFQPRHTHDSLARLLSLIKRFRSILILAKWQGPNGYELVVRTRWSDPTRREHVAQWKDFVAHDSAFASMIELSNGEVRLDTLPADVFKPPVDAAQDALSDLLQFDIADMEIRNLNGKISAVAPSTEIPRCHWTYNLGYQFFDQISEARIFGNSSSEYNATINAHGPFASGAFTYQPWTSEILKRLRFLAFVTANIMLPTTIQVSTQYDGLQRAFTVSTLTSLGIEVGLGTTFRVLPGLSLYANVLVASIPLRGTSVNTGDSIDVWESEANRVLDPSIFCDFQYGIMLGVAAAF